MHRITQTEGNLITVRVSGKLTTADYADLIPAWDQLLAAQGSMRMLFIMENFHGWQPAAAWKDLSLRDEARPPGGPRRHGGGEELAEVADEGRIVFRHSH